MLKHPFPGQSIQEYSLVIGLVVIVAIGGISLLSQQVQQGLTASLNSSAPQTTSLTGPTTTTAGGSIGSEDNNLLPPARASTPAPPGTDVACFGRVCVNLPRVDSTNDLVDASAGRGAERIHGFAKVLDEMAQSIIDNKGDAQLAQLISNLAKSGHTVGDAQATIANHGTYIMSTETALTSTYSTSKANFDQSFSTLTQYLVKNPGILDGGATGIITQQVTQINTLIGAVKTPMAGRGSVSANIEVGTVRLTHQSANTICDQGGKDCTRPLEPTAQAAAP